MGKIIAKAARDAGLDKISAVRSTSEAATLLGQIAEPGDLVLVKGSRSARTEEVIEEFSRHQMAMENSP
jgi:UDP-N-acetylmuramyl pentapeptide synthase